MGILDRIYGICWIGLRVWVCWVGVDWSDGVARNGCGTCGTCAFGGRWGGGFVEYSAGEGVDEAGEEFFGVGAVLEVDVVREWIWGGETLG